ncbi:MAG TPA: hypothetical protein VMR75_02800, partial [Candidatus Saccharimonadales bacterium]|nr:hypothetical protein [Candidatus Saccharimonadales bacterium]
MNRPDVLKIGQDFKNQDILSLNQFDPSSLQRLFGLTSQFKEQAEVGKISQTLQGKLITLLFFEPSTRTFSSFAAGIKRLGGHTIEYQNPGQTSSATKGESIEDMAQVFACYSDMIIVRHSEAGALARFAAAAEIPVINAGDGAGEHPTQALFDMFTVHEKHRRLDNLTGVVAGDLLYGRTAHSFLDGLSIYKNNT